MAQDLLLVLDCGGANPQHIARSVRGIGVYSEIVDSRRDWADIARRNPAGIIALGGDAENCAFPPDLLRGGAPVLAIGEAARAMVRIAGGGVSQVLAEQKLLKAQCLEPGGLFEGMDGQLLRVESACALELPEGFAPLVVSASPEAVLAFGDAGRGLYGLQSQIERNDIDGYRLVASFVRDICRCEQSWTLDSYLEATIEGLRNRVGEGIAICPVTGGVDTAVCAALAHKALGARSRCLFTDAGLLCEGESEGIERAFGEVIEAPLLRIPARERFLARLSGVTGQREKQETLAREYAQVLQEQGLEMKGRELFLIRGTIYNDLLESAPVEDAPQGWTPLEPIRSLFKYEVRQLAERLGLPAEIARRQPFPTGGLAMRCLGEVTGERLDTLRTADAVFKRVIEAAGADKGLRQYFAVLAQPRQGEGESVILRAVQNREGGRIQAARLSYDILDDAVREIYAADRRVARVLYDLSPGPPARIEWE